MSGERTTDSSGKQVGQTMGLSPERLAGQDSAAAGGDATRGLAGLKPQRLAGQEHDTLGGMVETRVDGSQVLVGVYASEQEARRAAGELESLGYGEENVRILAKSIEEARAITDQVSAQQSEAGAEPEAERMQGEVGVEQVSKINTGTVVGLLAGAAAGAVLGLAALEMPGLSGLLAGNQVVAMAAGAMVFAGVGAWGGSLAGYGVGDEETVDYADDLHGGAWLVAVRTNRIDQALAVLRDFGARNLEEDAIAH